MLVDLGPNDMIAHFGDAEKEAINSGLAIFNNGFRSAGGAYYSKQPDFIVPKGAISGELAKLGIALAGAVACEIVIPFTKKLVMEKVYPNVCNQIDKMFAEKEQSRSDQKKQKHKKDCDCHIVNVSDRIKIAV